MRPKAVIATSEELPIEIAGMQFHVRGAGRAIEVRAAPDLIDAAAHAVTLHDALYDYQFDRDPNVFTGERASDREIAIRSHNLPPHRVIELLASAARWPLVIDPNAEEEVQRRLRGAKAPEIAVTAAWDQVAKTLIEQYGLATRRLNRVWLLGSSERYRKLAEESPRSTVSFFTLMNLEDAARAMRAASSERGSVIINKRLSAIVSHDTTEVLSRQKAILSELDGVTRPPVSRVFSGAPVNVHLRDADIRDLVAMVQKFTGVNAIVAPDVRGTVSMRVENVPWDEAFDAALAVTGNTFALRNGVLEIKKDQPREEEIVVETVRLRREDPAFFEAWKQSVSPRGSIVIDRNARVLIIRDTESNARSMRRVAENIDSEVSQPAKLRIASEVRQRGLKAAIAVQQKLKATDRDYDFDEPAWNDVGYKLLTGDKALALQVFEMVVAEYPQSANAYDSLAEAQLANGMREEAIRNYRRALELNPNLVTARNALKNLGQ